MGNSSRLGGEEIAVGYWLLAIELNIVVNKLRKKAGKLRTIKNNIIRINLQKYPSNFGVGVIHD
jgi:hypothetical protein